jgi:hypothetical protein
MEAIARMLAPPSFVRTLSGTENRRAGHGQSLSETQLMVDVTGFQYPFSGRAGGYGKLNSIIKN